MFINRLGMIVFALSAVTVIAAMACGGSDIKTGAPDPTPTATHATVATERVVYDAPPPMTIDVTKNYQATVELEKGVQFTIDLHEKQTPITVNNFVFLAREGYYDGLSFHLVVGGYYAQGGSGDGTEQGHPGYFIENEFRDDLRHLKRGTVSMANEGIVDGKATNGSQFFIMYVAAPWFDGLNRDGTAKDCAATSERCHTIFGQVIQGMDNVRGLFARDPLQDSPPDLIKRITIQEG